jgi:glycosyltransferase involved in cell wall biosynthesis
MTDVSLIIPCYNSASSLEKRVADFEAVLQCTHWSWEILLCDDASRDDTPRICRELAEAAPERRRYLPSAVNRGRGRNVADGLRATTGRIVGFSDADASTSAAYLVPAVQALESGFDIAEANRAYKIEPTKLPYIAHRLFAHMVYSALVAKVLDIHGHDTETGFKFFRREVMVDLVSLCRSDGWFWDTEVIANAHRRGYRVADIPSLFVRTKGMPSTVRLLKDSWIQFRSLMRFARENPGPWRGPCCK